MNIVLMLLALLPQDDKEKAKALLKEAAAVAKDAPVVAFECETTYSVDESKTKSKVVLKRPNLARIEMDVEGEESLYVLDGKTYWYYDKSSNEYMKFPQDETFVDSLGLGPVASLLLQREVKALDEAKSVKLSKEKIGSDECDVIAWAVDEMEFKLWIDAKKGIRRYFEKIKVEDESYETTVDFSKFDFAPKPAEDAFTFTPPKGSKEMDPGEGDELLATGTDAPEFEATDLDGKPVKLSDFKGKAVLLNFWFYN